MPERSAAVYGDRTEVNSSLSLAPGTIRRVDVDWLRVLAVLLLVPFHAARIFNGGEAFYAKNAELSDRLSTFIAFVNPWHMPLLFVLAGASTYFALGQRTGAEYLRERVQRLLLPLVFGVLVVVPPQGFYAMLTSGVDPGSYLSYYPRFFHLDADLSGYYGSFTPAHLWFILFLAVFSVVALPLFVQWESSRGYGLPVRFASICQRPGMLFLLAIPLAVAAALPDLGGKNPFFYGTLFVFGYLLFSEPRLQRAIHSHTWWALGLGGITMALYLTIRYEPPKYSSGDIALHLLRNFNTWFWVLALLGLGHRYLSNAGRVLRYLSESSYPFYILHQTVIVMIGYYVVQTNAPLGIKFATIVVASLIATFGMYEAFVRRWNPLRLAFGMKPISGRRLVQSPNWSSAARPPA
jgi:peptidoglycan/LPS O-acetylase OafA/YrhL